MDHLMKQHEHLTMKHAKVREDIKKLQKYNEEQVQKEIERQQQEERFR